MRTAIAGVTVAREPGNRSVALTHPLAKETSIEPDALWRAA
jgi:hypothetical protein